MNISFSGRLDQHDLAKILRLHNKLSPFAIVWRLFAMLGISLGATLATQAGQIFPVAFALFLILILAYPFWAPLTAGYAYSQNKALQDLVVGTITETSIRLQTSEARSEIKWTLFNKLKESQEIVLLYQNSNSYLYFPRKFFASDADWQAFRELASTRTAKI